MGFQARCAPILKEVGFRNPAKGNRDIWPATRRNVFIRRRGDIHEHVFVYWNKWGAGRFEIYARTSQAERMRPPGCGPPHPRLLDLTVRSAIWRRPSGRIIYVGRGFGRGRVDRTLELAARRLVELDRYLKTGEPSWVVNVECNRRGFPAVTDDPTVSLPIFWPNELEVELEAWPAERARTSRRRP